jgi:hypothetical protein
MTYAAWVSTTSCAQASPRKTARSARPDERLKTLPRIGDRVVVDGDLVMSEAEAAKHLADQTAQAPRPPGTEQGSGEDTGYLIVAQSGVWPARIAANLTFAIDRGTFRTDDQYQLVKTNLEAAAREWSEVCRSCGVKFVHVEDLDDKKPTPGKVVFVARHRNAGGAFIAAAFFANDAQDRRFLDIDPTYFTTRYDQVGVFRHELGHVLGYRHEHTRGVPGCSFEDGMWTAETVYDPRSVMHYPCGSGGSMELAISEFDRTGHEAAYGGRAP